MLVSYAEVLEDAADFEMVFCIPIALCILQSSCTFSISFDPPDDGVEVGRAVTIIPMPFCRWRNQWFRAPSSSPHCFASFMQPKHPSIGQHKSSQNPVVQASEFIRLLITHWKEGTKTAGCPVLMRYFYSSSLCHKSLPAKHIEVKPLFLFLRHCHIILVLLKRKFLWIKD